MSKVSDTDVSLSEVHGSVETNVKGGFWRRLFAFLGPAYLVSVGYMDPGNWATDLAGGSRFGYHEGKEARWKAEPSRSLFGGLERPG